jgi:peptide/nickel transport system permease protein
VNVAGLNRHGGAHGARLMKRARAERRWTTYTLMAGLTIVVSIFLLGLAAPLLGFEDPNRQDLTNALAAPSLDHPFGTDNVGRDILARVLAATPLDYGVAVTTTYAALAIGLALGALAGYFGGWVDSVIMRAADVVIAFPFIIFALAFVAILGAGLGAIFAGFIAFGWAPFARLTRAEMLVLRERQYMLAARTLGLPVTRIICLHALPHLLRPNLVYSMASIVLNVIGLATLSYLGLGVQPPTPEWGAIVADGQQYLFTEWWVATLPGVFIVVVGAGFSLLGDGLADRLGYEIRLAA